MADHISKWTASEIDELLGKGLVKGEISQSTSGIDIILTAKDGSKITVRVPYAGSSSVASTAKNGLIRGTELATLKNLSALEDYVTTLVELAKNGGGAVDLTAIEARIETLEADAMRTIVEVAGVDYITTTAPTSSTGTTGLPLYWLARPAVFAVRSGTTYYTMPSTDERFAACGLRRVGQLFKCGGETFYLDADLNPVFVNSSVRFDRSGTSVKVYPSNSTLRSLYEAAGAVWNENTGYYELNGVNDIDEEEINDLYAKMPHAISGARQCSNYPSIRTIYKPTSVTYLSTVFADDSSLISVPEGSEVVVNLNYNMSYGYYKCKNLRISGLQHYAINSVGHIANAFTDCNELVFVKLYKFKIGFDVQYSPRISYRALQYYAQYADNTDAITITLPTGQAGILDVFAQKAAAGNLYANEDGSLNVAVTFPTPAEITALSTMIAALPWEAKLKKEYTQPIWREDNGSTIEFTNRVVSGSSSDMLTDHAYSDVRPSLIKHEKGANGEYIYSSWQEYVATNLASDQAKAGSELAQYTTANNTTFATSFNDWYLLYKAFGSKNITIADGGAAAASEV